MGAAVKITARGLLDARAVFRVWLRSCTSFSAARRQLGEEAAYEEQMVLPVRGIRASPRPTGVEQCPMKAAEPNDELPALHG